MPSDLQLSVREAAERLGVSPAAVRLRIAGGELPAVKLGRDWRLDEREVLRLARRGDGSGRPLSPAMAWAVLLLASRDALRADRLAGAPRYRARARQWLREHPLADDAARLRERPDVLLTGGSAADVVGLVGEAQAVEFYAAVSQRDSIIVEHALLPGAGAVAVRWVPDDIWRALDVADRVAPRAVVLVDLLESEDPRARREAARALAQ